MIPRTLIALTLVACGGRYHSEGQGGGEGATTGVDDASDDRAGSSSTASGGVASGGKSSVGAGGMATGTSGTSMAVGGTVAMGGMATGSGGAAISMGGKSGTADDAVTCKTYCGAVSNLCGAPFDQCYQDCSNELGAGTGCHAGNRQKYDCLLQAYSRAMTCEDAVNETYKICDSDQRVSIFGDGTGCHAVTSCGTHEADLHCVETGGPPACTCYLDGKKVREVMTSLDYSKAACVSNELRLLCAVNLP